MDSTHLPVEPVLIHLATQDDDVTLAELEVSRFLAIIVVEGFCTRELGYTLQIGIVKGGGGGERKARREAKANC